MYNDWDYSLNPYYINNVPQGQPKFPTKHIWTYTGGESMKIGITQEIFDWLDNPKVNTIVPLLVNDQTPGKRIRTGDRDISEKQADFRFRDYPNTDSMDEYRQWMETPNVNKIPANANSPQVKQMRDKSENCRRQFLFFGQGDYASPVR